eukprot:TRINITY_DN15821_c0_g1_i1.p1 TRINITY_DN15821_c0_g1~~TRINITY_DN15821_c0_g1_i1.p1  ORF type:complete len:422 (+),score=141.63 TRINITY_DN15821_c0_g1_i1:49-1314(+)
MGSDEGGLLLPAAPGEGAGGAEEEEPVFKCWREGNVCIACGEGIPVGALIAPRLPPGEGAAAACPVEDAADAPLVKKGKPKLKVAWLHAACAQRLPPCPKDARPVCMHWKRGECLLGGQCWFRHPDAARGADAGGGRRILHGRRKYVRNDGRANVFRKFLLEKFGEERLRQGSGVLDVAGGKGELGFQFVNLNAVPSTVVDPRPMELAQFSARYTQGMYHRNTFLSKHNTAPFPADPAARAPAPPEHLRIFMDDALLGCLGEAPSDRFEAHFEQTLATALATTWTRKGLESHEDDTDVPEEDPAPAGDGEVPDATPYPHMEDSSAAWGLLRHAACVVGLHPDQAAGGIVDMALKLRVPFAVVPCCVYAKSFPKRKDPEGRQVQSYEQLVAYLAARGPGIRTDRLDFGGKNTVVWWDPASAP